MNIANDPRTVRKALLYIYRALGLRCPTCGERPIFLPMAKVRSLDDWFAPLDGCPKCGYAYDREPGYFLMAIWGVNYGVIGLGSISSYFILRTATEISPTVLFFICVVPAPFLSILFARHAKSLFLALDLFFDPHTRIQKNKKSSE
jgi:uncharacterized protein (DUF983 family)